MNRLLITICGRAGSKGFKNKNLKTFCGHPLVYYSLSAAELFIKKHPELHIDIALNTDSPELAELVAAKYPEVIFLPRGEEVPALDREKKWDFTAVAKVGDHLIGGDVLGTVQETPSILFMRSTRWSRRFSNASFMTCISSCGPVSAVMAAC